MTIDDFADQRPLFVLENSFTGSLRGWGVTVSRMGHLQNRLTIDAKWPYDVSANTLTLKKTYIFDDGHDDVVTWTIISRGEGKYEGREKLVGGKADGQQADYAFRWKYAREVPAADGPKTKFGFDDWLFPHDRNHITTRTWLTKVGIEFATLSAFYERVT